MVPDTHRMVPIQVTWSRYTLHGLDTRHMVPIHVALSRYTSHGPDTRRMVPIHVAWSRYTRGISAKLIVAISFRQLKIIEENRADFLCDFRPDLPVMQRAPEM